LFRAGLNKRSRTVIPNQGAVRRGQGCRQILKKNINVYNNWLLSSALMLGVPNIAIFGMVGCRQAFFSPKGCLEPLKAEKQWSRRRKCYIQRYKLSS